MPQKQVARLILPYLNGNAVHTIYSLYTTQSKNKAKKQNKTKQTKQWEKQQTVGLTVSCAALMAKPLWCHGTAIHL